MRSSICILFLFLLSISVAQTPSPAEGREPNWKHVPGKDGQAGILYDPESVVYMPGNVVRVWIWGNGMPPRRILEEFNCSHKIVRDVQVVTEIANKPPQTMFVPSDWRGVIQDSPLGELHRILCR